MTDRHLNPNDRKKLAWCYHRALEAGDFEAVTSVLALAEHDNQLAKLILEVNENRLSTLQGGTDTQIQNNPFEEERIMQISIRNRIETSWLTTLTVSLIVLLIGAIFFFGGQPDNSVIHLSGNGLPVVEQDNAEPLSQEAINLALVEDMIERVVKAPAPMDVLNQFFAETVNFHHGFFDLVMPVSPQDVGTSFTGLRSCSINGKCELNVDIEIIGAVDDKVTVQYVYDYTSEGSIEGWGYLIPEAARLEGVWIFRIEDDKIAELWEYSKNPFILLYYRDEVRKEYQAELEAMGDVPIATKELIHDFVDRYVDALWNGDELDTSIFEVYRPPFDAKEQAEREALIELYTAIHSAFPDDHMTITDVMIGKTRFAIHFLWKGTHTETFEYENILLPPTNEDVSTSGIIVFDYGTGMVIKETWYVDFPFLSEMEQITEG